MEGVIYSPIVSEMEKIINEWRKSNPLLRDTQSPLKIKKLNDLKKKILKQYIQLRFEQDKNKKKSYVVYMYIWTIKINVFIIE